MSLKAWKNEFFSMERRKPTSLLGFLRGDLRLFKGLRKKNLEKHDIELKPGFGLKGGNKRIFEPLKRQALCDAYYNFGCKGCPVFKRTQKYCDCEGDPLDILIKHQDPEPMIDLLNKILKEEYPNVKN